MAELIRDLLDNASLAEIVFSLIELAGLCYVWILTKRSIRRLDVARRYKRTIEADDLPHQYEASAMIEMAEDRRQRKLALLVVMVLGFLVGAWAMLTPQPRNPELQLFSVIAGIVFIARDLILVISSRQTFVVDDRIGFILSERRKILKILEGSTRDTRASG